MANERWKVGNVEPAEGDSEGYLKNLELAIALSLESLEMDRLRREQKYSLTTSYTGVSNNTQGVTNTRSTNETIINKSRVKMEANSHNYNRWRPGTLSEAPPIPPPPRRQTSLPHASSVKDPTASIPDLMSFSSPDVKGSKRLEPEFDPLLNGAQMKIQPIPTSTKFLNPSSSTVVPTVPSLQITPLSSWNFPSPYLPIVHPKTPVNPVLAHPYPGSSLIRLPLESCNVIKTLEKKPNGNLIDFSFYERSRLREENTETVDAKDVLESFDPLLVNLTPNIKPAVREKVDTEAPSKQQQENPQQVKDVELSEVQVRRPERLQSQRSESHKIRRNRVYESVKILSDKTRISPELKCFKENLVRLRRHFSNDDISTNVGHVISSTLDSLHEETISVKLAIYSVYTSKPICFACDITTSVEHVVSQIICSIYDDISNINLNHYCLKVHGKSEYLSFNTSLVDYEFVHRCHKFDEVVRLTALDSSRLERPLARTMEDDEVDIKQVETKLLALSNNTMTEKNIGILTENLDNEIMRTKREANGGKASSLQVNGIIQSAKLICTKMAQVETKELREAVNELNQVMHYFSTAIDGTELSSKKEAGILTELATRSVSDCISLLPNTAFVRMQILILVLEKVKEAVQQLIETYCRSFQVDFPLADLHPPSHSVKDITAYMDTLLVHVSSVHRLPLQWLSTYESFVVECEVYHGIRLLSERVETQPAKMISKFYNFINFENWVELTGLLLCILPKESRLCCTLYGLSHVITDGVSHDLKVGLCWATLPLFNYNGELSQGRHFCGMWSMDENKRLGPAVSNTTDQYCAVMQLDLPDFGCTVLFPPVIRDLSQNRNKKCDFEQLKSNIQQKLLDLVEGLSSNDVVEDRETLWQMRRYLYEIPQALPKILLAAHSWDWSCLSDIYQMLNEWKPMSGVDALELLLPCFPDCKVRKIAISWIQNMSSDELCDYLPQLVQALKYETYDTSCLAEFLIERSLSSIRVMHNLYWLLKQNVDDRRCGRRMLLMFNSLIAVAGKAMRKHFDDQEELVSKLSRVATRVKESKDSLRLSTLMRGMDSVKCELEESPACLPLSPSLDVCGVDVKSCNYYTSKTIPLKLVFRALESSASSIEAIFKIGDDLRQDMLTIQMIRIMDKLWLKEGLNLQIVTFGCISTAFHQGIVEVVSGADTLGRIQKEHGLTGPFKDHPIAEWLQKYNTTDREYVQAVDNFTYSCAGYSVATYILGICDRHNDNIMIKSTGHLFHIDFGKFLGDCETFGGLKRDRVPFVLTSDMAYVINGGDRPSDKFQHFVDLCCQAFNVIRKHGNLFLNLFSLMVSAGIPGVSDDAVNYIQKALLPELSECEAAISFTRMIEDSLKSWFTQFNFFIHNLAQLKFSSEHNSDCLLSFVPRAYTMENDGKIISVEVVGYQKRYEPEKFYVYSLKVEREGQPGKANLLRSYGEFCEFHHKLCTSFPLAKYRNLPKVYIGRSNVRQVAEKRKVEIESFLNCLWKMADEIKHCDLVYTFLHPLLRDLHEENEKKAKIATTIPGHDSLVTGSVKLSIHYKNDTLFVMILHAKNLSEVKNQTPDTYVKTYLVPDPTKSTKRKTKTVYRNSHPTYMEMMTYRLGLETVEQRWLQVSVWHHGIMSENTFLGAVSIGLKRLDLKKQTTNWYQLGNVEKLLQR